MIIFVEVKKKFAIDRIRTCASQQGNLTCIKRHNRSATIAVSKIEYFFQTDEDLARLQVLVTSL